MIMRTDVSFTSAGLELAGHLYIPDDESAGPWPGVVVSHPASGVKEQTAVGKTNRIPRAVIMIPPRTFT
jgi:uncharacterized protein